MIIPQTYRLKNTIKYPTTIIVGGLNKLGIELARSLIEQGGYVIIVDALTPARVEEQDVFKDGTMISYLDYTSILHLEEDVRRVDYVFYFAHEAKDLRNEISTQEFLTFSNYLDAVLSVAAKFEARFLLTTSIKAHQILNSEQSLLSASLPDSEQHRAYTEMELQKYAEGLVLEYNQKVNLNARITRLGEIIGEGIDFSKETAFNQLIFDAVQGNPLVLKNDGLEHEWLVHVMDCTYGLIKAQFAKNTEGKVYSLTYENTFSHIAIAYKIQELEENAKDIRFKNTGKGIAPISLKKPAPNLSRIGWMPRVSFDRAVSQSLAAARLFLVEHKAKNLPSQSKEDKVTTFMNFAAGTRGRKAPKGVDQIKRERVRRANAARLRQQRLQREKTVSRKIEDSFWNFFKKFTNTFSFFKTKSPLETGLILSGFVVIILLYIFVFSPLLVVIRNVLVLFPEYRDLASEWEASNYEAFTESAEKVHDSLSELSKLSEQYEGVAEFFLLGSQHEKLQETINSYLLFAEGLQDTTKILKPVSEYTKAFENNTQVRAGSEGYLSVLTPPESYKDQLSEIETNAVFLQAGLEKMENAKDQLRNTDYVGLPPVIQERLQNVEETVLAYDFEERVTEATYMPELFGLQNPTTSLLVLLDNSRPTPLGGDMAAFALVTMQDGGIVEIKVQDFSSEEFDLSAVDEITLEEVNVARFNRISESELEIGDLASISDMDLYGSIMTDIFEDTFDTKPDIVQTITIESFAKYLALVPDSSQITISNVEISEDNFLTALNATQSSNASLAVKHANIAQIAATVFFQILESSENDSRVILDIFRTARTVEGSRVYAQDLEYQEFLDTYNYTGYSYTKDDVFSSVGLLNGDPQVIAESVFPDTTLTYTSEIDEEFDTRNVLDIALPINTTINEVSFCTSLEVSPDEIEIQGIPETSYAINSTDTRRCAAIHILDETKVRIIWTQIGIIAEDVEEATLDFGVTPVLGTQTTLDYTFSVDSDLSLDTEASTIPPLSGGKIGFKKDLRNTETFKLVLNK